MDSKGFGIGSNDLGRDDMRAVLLGIAIATMIGACSSDRMPDDLMPGDIWVNASGSTALGDGAMMHYMQGHPVVSGGRLGSSVTVLTARIQIDPDVHVIGTSHEGANVDRQPWKFYQRILYQCNHTPGNYQVEFIIDINISIDTRLREVSANGMSVTFVPGMEIAITIEKNGDIVLAIEKAH